MKKCIAFVMTLVCVLGMCGCKKLESEKTTETSGSIPKIEPDVFSYAEDRETYREGDPGVKTSGFVNTFETEITIENVVEHAKNECTVKYDTVAVWLDKTECIWSVLFCTQGVLGGGETVYMDYAGKTVLIVYGE